MTEFLTGKGLSDTLAIRNSQLTIFKSPQSSIKSRVNNNATGQGDLVE